MTGVCFNRTINIKKQKQKKLTSFFSSNNKGLQTEKYSSESIIKGHSILQFIENVDDKCIARIGNQ